MREQRRVLIEPCACTRLGRSGNQVVPELIQYRNGTVRGCVGRVVGWPESLAVVLETGSRVRECGETEREVGAYLTRTGSSEPLKLCSVP